MSSEDDLTTPVEPAPAPATAAPPRALPAAAVATPPGGRSPGLALFLSFVFPGAGQLYNGQAAKAFAFFFALVSAIYLTAQVDPMPFAFMIPFVIIYNLIDAWKSANLLNLRAAGGQAVDEDPGFESPAWGGGLIALGLLLLANNLGWLRLSALQRYWPVLLILLGVWFLAQAVRGAGEQPGGNTQA